MTFTDEEINVLLKARNILVEFCYEQRLCTVDTLPWWKEGDREAQWKTSAPGQRKWIPVQPGVVVSEGRYWCCDAHGRVFPDVTDFRFPSVFPTGLYDCAIAYMPRVEGEPAPEPYVGGE